MINAHHKYEIITIIDIRSGNNMRVLLRGSEPYALETNMGVSKGIASKLFE
jgi:hypothetical protein